MFAFKIWIITSILLTAYGVSISGLEDDICDKVNSDLCHSEKTRSFLFPANIEAMDKMCPAVISRFSCLLDYQKKCGPGSIDKRLPTFIELALDACDKSSELHQEFADNLPCLKRLMDNHHDVCHSIVDGAVKAVESRIIFKTDESEWDIEDYLKLTCLYEAFNYACIVARAGVDCGSETKEFAGRMIDRVGVLDVACQADIREEVKGMVEITQLKMEEKLAHGKITAKD